MITMDDIEQSSHMRKTVEQYEEYLAILRRKVEIILGSPLGKIEPEDFRYKFFMRKDSPDGEDTLSYALQANDERGVIYPIADRDSWVMSNYLGINPQVANVIEGQAELIDFIKHQNLLIEALRERIQYVELQAVRKDVNVIMAEYLLEKPGLMEAFKALVGFAKLASNTDNPIFTYSDIEMLNRNLELNGLLDSAKGLTYLKTRRKEADHIRKEINSKAMEISAAAAHLWKLIKSSQESEGDDNLDNS